MSRASSIKDSERNPPAISIGIDTEETIFLINSRLEPNPNVAYIYQDESYQLQHLPFFCNTNWIITVNGFLS